MRLLQFFLIFFLFSCEKHSANQSEQPKNYWERLEVVTLFQKITVERNSDSAEVETIVWDDGINNFPYKYIVKDTLYTKIYFTKSEKDSLKKWIFSSITKPKFTDVNVSDYVGNVKLKIIDRNTTLSCEYNSVGEWSKVSENTEKIYNLLNKKTKIPNQ